MKSLINGLVFASLMFALGGCGKENSSGSGGSSSKNLFNSGMSVTTQNVVTKLQNWYNGKVEGYPSYGVVNTQKQVRTYNTQPTCEQKSFLGIPYQYCKFNGTPSVQSFPLTLNIVQDGKAIKDKGNAELNAIFSGSLGKIVEAIDVGPSQSQITILKNDGSIVIYGINTQRHSSLNPEFKSESTQSQRIDTQIL